MKSVIMLYVILNVSSLIFFSIFLFYKAITMNIKIYISEIIGMAHYTAAAGLGELGD